MYIFVCSVIQALLAFLGYPGPFHHPWVKILFVINTKSFLYFLLFSKLYLNIYTAPAFFSALTAAINLVLFLVAFKDVRVVTLSRRSINGKLPNSSGD
jgi:hypothetical protein